MGCDSHHLFFFSFYLGALSILESGTSSIQEKNVHFIEGSFNFNFVQVKFGYCECALLIMKFVFFFLK